MDPGDKFDPSAAVRSKDDGSAVVVVRRGVGEETQRFVGYNPTADCWISLDRALRLAVGPYGALETGGDGGCLECRSWEDGVYVLGHDDAFWVLLLETLLDVPAPADPLHGAVALGTLSLAQAVPPIGRYSIPGVTPVPSANRWERPGMIIDKDAS
jgi:hypothetical protein